MKTNGLKITYIRPVVLLTAPSASSLSSVLTALSASSLWPSTPPRMATQAPVPTFQSRSVWSLLTDSSSAGCRGWNFTSFTA